MGDPGTRYSREFRAEAVSQVIDRGYTVVEVAKRIGVSENSLYRWVGRVREQRDGKSGGGSTAELAAENARLRSELKRTQEERDILRKAAAYFAKESERGTPS
jgi:transposase